MKKKKDSSICIIGAGASGLSMAFYLKEKGYSNVTVFEKNDSIGGKCYSELKYGQASGMGAIAITPGYKNTLDLIKRFELTIESCPKNTLLDFSDGYQYPLTGLFRGESRIKLFQSVLKYYFYIALYQGRLSKPGFRNITGTLAQPFDQWLKEKKLSNLEKLFSVPITCFGYGYLNQIPAMYAIKYMNFSNFTTLLRIGLADLFNYQPAWTKRLVNSFQNLMKELAKEVPELILKAEITGVSRKGENQDKNIEVTFREKNSKKKSVRNFDYLIISIPQETGELKFLDMSEKEKSLFDEVVHSDYYTIACEVKDFSCNFFLQLLDGRNFNVPDKGCPVMVSKVWEESDIAVFYSYSSDPITEKEVIKKLRENAARINREIVRIIEVKKWNYFPHVKREAIENGFYEKIEKLQGENNTFYTGSLLNFELVENVITYSKHLVKNFF